MPMFQSLSARIRATERCLDERQSVLRLHAITLAGQLRHEISQPSTLWCGAAIGFIAGELTHPLKRSAAAPASTASAAVPTSTPLEKALNWVTLAQTLSSAWPMLSQSAASASSPVEAGPASAYAEAAGSADPHRAGNACRWP
jgi:hypothetical protein